MAARKARHHRTKNKSKNGGIKSTAKETPSETDIANSINQEQNCSKVTNNEITLNQSNLRNSINAHFEEAMATALSFFDADTINFKGGNHALLKSIRNMISGMEDNKFMKYMEDVQTGKVGVEEIIQLLESYRVEENEPPGLRYNNLRSESLLESNTSIAKLDMIDSKKLNNELSGLYEEDFEEENDRNFASSNDNESENESGEEYSFDLELSDSFFDPFKFHNALFKLLRIIVPDAKGVMSKEQKRIHDLFTILATLCDPYTQPSSTGEHNEMILSADLVSDLVIALMYKDYVESSNGQTMNLPAFDMAYDLAFIIEKIMVLLNADDETNLIYINNDEEHWESELPKWLPHSALSSIVNIASDFHHMMLLYTIATASLLIIQKLYRNMGNICLNPFLSLYLQLWKNQTRIIYLGIEIDRRDEDNGFPGYPEVIRYMIKGASAVRSMISLILNDDFEKRLHDLKHESLINFMRPWGRKFTNGSITRDIRMFVAALLALGSELDSVTELLFNFDPEDRYDEDIKYMFEMELEDMEDHTNAALSSGGTEVGSVDNDKTEENIHADHGTHDSDYYHKHHKENLKRYVGKNGFLEIERHDEEVVDEYEDDEDTMFMNQTPKPPVYDLHPQCNCVFEDFESDYDEEEDYEELDDEADLSEEENDGRAKQIKRMDNNKFMGDFESLNHLSNIDLKDLDMETIQNLHLEAVRNINNGPSAVRATTSKHSAIDSKGRDWRDIPRGDNQILTPQFVELLKSSIGDSSIFLTPMENLLNSLQSMTSKTLDSQTCEKIIRSIAWVVQYEYESKLMSDEEAKLNNDPNVNADVIYNFLKLNDNFVKMMNHNPSSAFFIIDELLMAEGYRRVLIWFLTHLPLNQWIINYFHDLLVGQRGNPSENGDMPITRFSFSRQGPLVLSEVEKSMLLHEFLSNAVIYLSRGSSYELEDIMWNQIEEEKNGSTSKNNVSSFITNRSNAQKLIKVICLMLKSLEIHKIINPEDTEYRVEIQTLLVQWVGVGFVPEARELFFKYSNSGNSQSNPEESQNGDTGKFLLKKTVTENVNSKGPCEDTLSRLSRSKFYKLMLYLENFSSFDLFIITLNMAKHYRTDKSTCFDFMKDLNSIAHVYPSEEELLEAFDEFYQALSDALSAGDEEKIIEIMYASKFSLAETNIIDARKVIKIFIEGEGSTDIGNNDNLPYELLKQTELAEYIERQKGKSTISNNAGTSDMDSEHTLLNNTNGTKKTKKKSKQSKQNK